VEKRSRCRRLHRCTFGLLAGGLFGRAAWSAGALAVGLILLRVHLLAGEGEMIDAEVRVQIRRYFYAEHWEVGTISQALGVHPDTVKQAIEVERFHRAEQLRSSMLDTIFRFCARRWKRIRGFSPRACFRCCGTYATTETYNHNLYNPTGKHHKQAGHGLLISFLFVLLMRIC